MSAVFVKREPDVTMCAGICFVCGGNGAEFKLHVKPRDHGSCFPFLENHVPPDGSELPASDGSVKSCFLCHSFLNQQWEAFERNKTPHVKRLYWLKRADNGPYMGAEMRFQGEYASQFMGLQPSGQDYENKDRGSVNTYVDDDSADTILDLRSSKSESVPDVGRSELSSTPSSHLPEEREDQRVLDLSMPDKNSTTEVCYVCGEECSKGTLINVYAKPIANCPYFPSLMLHPRPSKSRPMDSTGRVQTCTMCHQHLLQQWDAYQRKNMAHSERNYLLRRRQLPPPANSTYVCFTCGLEYPLSSHRVLYSCKNHENEPSFPFLEKVQPPAGASPLSSKGAAKVCTVCYKSIHRQRHVYEISKTSESSRIYRIQNEIVINGTAAEKPKSTYWDKNEIGCFICNHIDNVKNMCVIHTVPNKYKSNNVYFPTLKNIPKALYACPLDEEGQMLVCCACHSFLMSQWDAFEAEAIHPDQRRYHVRSAVVNSSPEPYNHASRKVSSSRSEHVGPDTVLHVQVSTPDLHIDFTSRSLHSTPRNALLTTISNSSITPPISSHSQQAKIGTGVVTSSYQHKDKQAATEPSGPPAKLVVATNPCENHHHRPPLMVSCVCYVCGQHSDPGQTYSLRCYPQKSGTPNRYEEPPSGGQSAFFPFLTVHSSPPAADKMTDDGVVLVCIFCYHSLMAQWTAYETSPSAADRNPWNRIYNHHNYVCYVCGVTTYRKRVRGISVPDYPFLVEHPRPLGSLVLNSGEKVVVCLMCYHSMNAQWNDFERMKVPVELRKYNWIAAPAPPTDEEGRRSRQSVSTNGETLPPGAKGNQVIVIDDEETNYSHDSQYLSIHPSAESPQGLSHGSKPPPLTMLPPSGQKSITRTTATVPPLNQVSPNNSIVTSISNNPALNATRTSSFAAALRKLAKQATEPSPEKDISPVSSPVLSQRSVTPKRAPPPLILPGSQSVSISSPPVVTIAPTQTHLSLPDGRKSSDRGSLGHSGAPLIEPLSIKRDIGKGHHGLYMDKRDEALLSSKDLSNQFSHLRSHPTSSGRPEDVLLASRGFQPYRVTEDIRPSLPPPHMAFDHSPYSYHPMFLPPHMSPSAFRLDDPLYLERYGLIRQQMMPLSSPGMLSHHGVPFLPSGRYPPELLPPPVGLISPSSAALSQERLKYEEEQRHRERERERELEREREREREREEREREREREMELEREQERERRERERERERERAREREQQRALERQRELERDKEREKERERREHEALMMRNHDRRILSPHGINSESPAGRHGICNLIPTRDMHISKSNSQPCSQSTTPSAPSSCPNLGPFSAAALIAPPTTSSSLRAEKDAWIVNHQEHLYPDSMDYRHHYFAQQDYHDKMDREAKMVDRLWPKEYERHKEKPPEPPPPTSHHEKSSLFESNEKTLKRMLDTAPSISHHREQISISHSHHVETSVNHCRDCIPTSVNLHKPNVDQERTNPPTVERPPNAVNSTEQHDITVDDEKGRSCYVTKADGYRPSSNPPSLTAMKPLYECDPKKTYAMDFASHVPVISAGKDPKPCPQVSQDYLVSTSTACVVSDSVLPPERMEPPVVSKLDVEEQRLRKLRVNGTHLSDCDSEDGDEKLEKKHCKLLTITSGPPLKLDQSPKKLGFLEVVGLTTQQNKKDIEFGKYWSRCQRHHEDLKCQLLEEKTVEQGLRLSLENSSRTDELCYEGDYPQKTQFLKTLDLESIPKEKQRELETIWHAIVEERLRRNGFFVPALQYLLKDKVLKQEQPNVLTSKLSSQKRRKRKLDDRDHALKAKAPLLSSSVDKASPDASNEHGSTRTGSLMKLQHQSGGNSDVVPAGSRTSQNQGFKPSQGERRVVMLTSSSDLESNKDIKNFAQEFHKLVLQTTQQQQAMRLAGDGYRSITSTPEVKSSLMEGTNSTEDAADSKVNNHVERTFRWPGVEVLMEAYERYVQEQKLEREVLMEQCQRLQAHKQEMTNMMEHYKQLMAELMQVKQKLDEERCQHQESIDHLKRCLRPMR